MPMFPRDKLITHVGAYKTQSLFLETNKSDHEPLMTLKEVDWEYKGKILPSLKKIYMECADPTEYSVAEEVLGSWPHWQRLIENKAIKAYIDEWREELEIKIRSCAIQEMIKTAKTGSKGTTAAKYLADRGWDKRKAGAPSREEIERERKVQAGIAEDINEDFERLGLH